MNAKRKTNDQEQSDQRRESGRPGGGKGRIEDVSGSGVYPMSGPHPSGDAELQPPGTWGRSDYNEHGTSEVFGPDEMQSSQSAVPGSEPAADIFDTLINDGRFTTLVKAIEQASLMEGLMEPAAATVFAPTDEAFSKLPSGTMDFLLNNPPELTRLLSYHMIAERIPSNEIPRLNSPKTVEGSTLNINTSNGIHVNNASVIEADIMADNGTIHAIDTVLIPQSLNQMLTAR